MSPAAHVTSAQERVVWPSQASCDSPDRQDQRRVVALQITRLGAGEAVDERPAGVTAGPCG
jgi:hypothetical protein